MKKRYTYVLMLIAFAAITSFIIIKSNKDISVKTATYYFLQPRKNSIDSSQEWSMIRKQALALQQSIANNPADQKSMLSLASLFLQEARISGNYTYYDMAALQHVNSILKTDSLNFEAITLKAMILLSQHHFAEGLLLAEKAHTINPYNAFVYGILVDGNVEMGYYEKAVENADKMVSIRPDIRSYSRIAYLREIYGDYKGAIAAMKLAINAGAPGDETTAWCRTQTGKLYELTGDWKTASMHYTIALSERPSYAYALAGLGRVAKNNNDYDKAISLYQQSDAQVIGYTFKEDLAELYLLSGQKEKAMAIENEIIERMTKDAASGVTDERIGHYADMELAYAFLKKNDYDKALYHALQEYNRRPNNIDINEALAWVYYQRADYEKAVSHLKIALKTNSKHPRLLCRAGLIYGKAGDITTGKQFLNEGLKFTTAIDRNLKIAGEGFLKTH